MQILSDALGRDLQIGDTVVYTVRRRSSMALRIGRIQAITRNGAEYGLTVRAVKATWRGKKKAYQTTVYSNDTLVRLNTRAQK